MRPSPAPLLPILRSRVQGEILAQTYLHPDDEYSITDLARLVDASTKAVQQEVDRLVRNGYLLDRKLGTLRLVRAAPDTPIVRPLTDLLAVTYGPLPVVTKLLVGVGGIRRAFIYGSWAARYHGEPGPVPVDVDVLVVGEADVDELDHAAAQAERVLRREVNVRRVRPEVWSAGEDPFLRTVRERPLVELTLGDAPAPHPKEST
jgi:predicted nucleotidyltransferase